MIFRKRRPPFTTPTIITLLNKETKKQTCKHYSKVVSSILDFGARQHSPLAASSSNTKGKKLRKHGSPSTTFLFLFFFFIFFTLINSNLAFASTFVCKVRSYVLDQAYWLFIICWGTMLGELRHITWQLSKVLTIYWDLISDSHILVLGMCAYVLCIWLVKGEAFWASAWSWWYELDSIHS